jgi:uncharacterized protein (TIGR02996 family)
MSDRDALLAAICAQPDEDTPRLVFADYLEEYGESPRAAFIRTQVELAHTLPWEPLAVRCRWRQPDMITGKPFLASLPRVDGYHAVWPAVPFRRGFGWSLYVRNVSQWGEYTEPVFDREPVGGLNFWQGTLDDWKRVAASDCVRHFREVVFNLNPIEPLFALRDRPAACGITDLHFGRASGAGMPEVLEDLFRSPLGRAVRGISFHTGYESLNDLIDALNTAGPLERLSFSVMGITADLVRRLFAGPVAGALTELRFREEPLGSDGLRALSEVLPGSLRDLQLSAIGMKADGLEALSRCANLEGLQRLNLSHNPFTPRAARVLSLSRALAGLRSLDLSRCRIEDKSVRHITRSRFWLNLVELDLRQNPISAAGARHLLDAPKPPDLTAIALDGSALGGDIRSAIGKKYGDAIIFAAPEVQGV